MVDDAGIRGVTANPAIFEKAIAESDEYDEELGQLIARGKTPLEIYDALIIGDVQTACDALRPLFDRVHGADGFVSLEVSPAIARDTDKTVAEAKKYWAAVERPNLFIKIPANPQGIDAIRQATAAGISVNITLIFSNTVYAQVIEAYLAGLEERVSKGLPVSQIHSVASFFVSRVDTAVDKLLPEGSALRGKIAVANAKLAYQLFRQSTDSPRWQALEAKGATRQRPLWASTGTKNKAYSDVLYVESLIGPDTVNTLPLATLNAFNDHGKVAETITQGLDEARAQLNALAAAGIDLEQVCTRLTEDGLDLFANALTSLLKTIEGRSLAQRSLRAMKLLEKPGAAFQGGLDRAAKMKAGARLWARDAALWGGGDPARASHRLGWLDLPARMRHDAPELASFALEAAQRFKHCLVLGPASLAAGVFARVLGKREGGLDLRVLDSTAPETVRAAVRGFDLSKTLFIVSGRGPGIDALYKHFRGEVEKAGGGNIAAPQQDALQSTPYGSHFVAIAEEGSPLQQMARREGFWRTWTEPAGLGDFGASHGALGFSGLVPAALLGLDVGKLLDAVDQVALASGASVPLKENLAVRLGALLESASALRPSPRGADKLTFLLSPELLPLGGWLEQLIAESNSGTVPVAGEPLGNADSYGPDRVFISLSFATEKHDASFLAKAGYPLVQWQLVDQHALAGEVLRWELASAIAAAVREVEPSAVTAEKTSELPADVREPSLRANGLALFTNPDHAQLLKKAASTTGGGESPAHWIAAHLALGDAGADYAALLVWLPPTDELHKELRTLQGHVRDTLRLPCTARFGPRALHASQDNGVFLQLTSDGGDDLPIPGEAHGFGALFAAQARDELETLLAHGRRALRVHVEDGDSKKVLSILNEALSLLKG
jgi:transaldolase/glucose-6-phosphate isomerase